MTAKRYICVMLH